jgi:hypothetical protein
MKRKFTLALALGFALCFTLSSSLHGQSITGPVKKAVPVNLTVASEIAFADVSSAGDLLPKTDDSRPVAPGTIATSSAPDLRSTRGSSFRVEPDYLPSWITNQPLAYLRYGAAPAVVNVQFGRK